MVLFRAVHGRRDDLLRTDGFDVRTSRRSEGSQFPAAREPFAAADCTREAACGVMGARRPPVALLLPLFFPMLIASSSSMGGTGPARYRVFAAACSLTSTDGSLKEPVRAGSGR